MIRAAPALSLAIAGLVIASAALHRAPLFQDEIINTARTFVGFSNYSENVLDYSLRPIFRLLNMLWAVLFGTRIESLWFGSALIAVATVFALQRVGAFAGGPLLAFVAPLLFLATPLSLEVGVAAMPHLPSALPATLATMLLVVWQTERRHGVRLVTGSFLLAAVALLTHPTQIALVVALGAVTAALAIVGLVKDGKRALLPALSGYGAFLVVIALVELAYRALTVGAVSKRLLPGATFSYLNHWLGNVLQIDSNIPRKYVQPPSFYISYLIQNHALFLFMFLGVIAVTAVVVIRRKSWSDAAYFIPAVVVIIWVAVASRMGICEPRVLVGVTPLATASTLLLIGRCHVERLGRILIAAAVVWAVLALVPQVQTLARPGKPARVAAYRLFAGLPPGDVAWLDVEGAAEDYRHCMYLANATGRRIVKVNRAELFVTKHKLKYVCTSASSRQVMVELLARPSAPPLRDVLRMSNIELWVPVPLVAVGALPLATQLDDAR